MAYIYHHAQLIHLAYNRFPEIIQSITFQFFRAGFIHTHLVGSGTGPPHGIIPGKSKVPGAPVVEGHQVFDLVFNHMSAFHTYHAPNFILANSFFKLGGIVHHHHGIAVAGYDRKERVDFDIGEFKSGILSKTFIAENGKDLDVHTTFL